MHRPIDRLRRICRESVQVIAGRIEHAIVVLRPRDGSIEDESQFQSGIVHLARGIIDDQAVAVAQLMIERRLRN